MTAADFLFWAGVALLGLFASLAFSLLLVNLPCWRANADPDPDPDDQGEDRHG